MLDAGFSILDTGYSLLDTRYWILVTGYWVLVTGYRFPVKNEHPGSSILPSTAQTYAGDIFIFASGLSGLGESDIFYRANKILSTNSDL
jgi:hypothetical protein